MTARAGFDDHFFLNKEDRAVSEGAVIKETDQFGRNGPTICGGCILCV